MSAILLGFGIAEGALLLGCILTFVWGMFRGWELEMFVPIVVAINGSILLALLLPVVIVIHDHVHVHMG